MLKSEVQHQFWITKKVFERKLGTKEDECVVSSDAELDAKIELFKAISASCGRLYKIIDQYQERLCILAQEENALGKFLKEAGKNSNTSGKAMTCTAKAIAYCGQQRMIMRPPLLRLFHEVETFTGRAIEDTYATIMSMEKERTEYRASLSWMKSASTQLDPDSGRGVEKFRKAQNQVRLSKAKFDRLSLDCLQKIDLLAAARCNMFSHALVAYMAALMQFATKSSETFMATSQALLTSTQYNFCVLRDLTQSQQQNMDPVHDVTPIDSDQMLFFLDDYVDNKDTIHDETVGVAKPQEKHVNNLDSENLLEMSLDENKQIVQETINILDDLMQPTINPDLKELEKAPNLMNFRKEFDEFISEEFSAPSFMPSQLLLEDTVNNLNSKQKLCNLFVAKNMNDNPNAALIKSKNSILDFSSRPNVIPNSIASSEHHKLKKGDSDNSSKNKQNHSNKDMSSWFNLFAELDPLSNSDTLANELDNSKANNQAA